MYVLRKRNIFTINMFARPAPLFIFPLSRSQHRRKKHQPKPPCTSPLTSPSVSSSPLLTIIPLHWRNSPATTIKKPLRDLGPDLVSNLSHLATFSQHISDLTNRCLSLKSSFAAAQKDDEDGLLFPSKSPIGTEEMNRKWTKLLADSLIYHSIVRLSITFSLSNILSYGSLLKIRPYYRSRIYRQNIASCYRSRRHRGRRSRRRRRWRNGHDGGRQVAVVEARVVSHPAESPCFCEMRCDILDVMGGSWYDIRPPLPWFEGSKERLQLVVILNRYLDMHSRQRNFRRWILVGKARMEHNMVPVVSPTTSTRLNGPRFSVDYGETGTPIKENYSGVVIPSFYCTNKITEILIVTMDHSCVQNEQKKETRAEEMTTACRNPYAHSIPRRTAPSTPSGHPRTDASSPEAAFGSGLAKSQAPPWLRPPYHHPGSACASS